MAELGRTRNELVAENERLHAMIAEHNKSLIYSCEHAYNRRARGCSSKAQCHDCPKEWIIELE